MSENTKIEWCDHTFNPWEGCQKVGPGCDHCYAETRNARFAGGTAINWGPGAPRRRTSPANWAKPRIWNAAHAEFFAQHGRRQRVFCASLADVFDNAVPREWRDDLATLILDTPHLDWLLLTKRIGNAGAMLGKMFLDGPPDNIRVGATVCNQPEADHNIPKLLALGLPNFLSMEPLLGDVRLGSWLQRSPSAAFVAGRITASMPDWTRIGATAIDWVIVGGESGPGARPMHPDWARSLRDQCQAAGVPFLFKQWGEWAEAGASPSDAYAISPNGAKRPCEGTHAMCEALMEKMGKKVAGRHLDGRTWDEFPAPPAPLPPPPRVTMFYGSPDCAGHAHPLSGRTEFEG